MSERLIVAIVDDDEDIRQALAAMFSSNGYDVHCFVSAEEFLEQLKTLAISVIVTDLQMTGLSGLDLCRELRAQAVATPTLLITAFASDAVRVRAKRLGVRVVLEKPFDPAILLREVAAAAA